MSITLRKITGPTTVESVDPTTLKAVALTGRVVTYRDTQYRVHCVEGSDYYAFVSDYDTGAITIDFYAKPLGIREPVATIVPAWSRFGDGFAETVPVARLTPGVCLIKFGDSVWH
ncbi:MAG TPA: hypothetical protein VJQ57_13675 [Acidimicrobiia bacterium]|nr:hypothetical protein [Acidimicrobiia bacterium]